MRPQALAACRDEVAGDLRDRGHDALQGAFEGGLGRREVVGDQRHGLLQRREPRRDPGLQACGLGAPRRERHGVLAAPTEAGNFNGD